MLQTIKIFMMCVSLLFASCTSNIIPVIVARVFGTSRSRKQIRAQQEVATPVEAHFRYTFILSLDCMNAEETSGRACPLCHTLVRCSLLFPPSAHSGKKGKVTHGTLAPPARHFPGKSKNSPNRGVDFVGGGTFWGDYGVFAEAVEQRLNPAPGGQMPVVASRVGCVPELFSTPTTTWTFP